MVNQFSCYENAVPKCREGEAPAPASHSCFALTEDLLHASAASVKPLAPPEEAALRGDLTLLAAWRDYLESYDRLGPGTRGGETASARF